MCNLFAALMSLCDSDTKNQVESMSDFPDLEKRLESMVLLAMIKKLVYTGGIRGLNTSQNKAMSHVNLMNLYQDKLQDISILQGPIYGHEKIMR